MAWASNSLWPRRREVPDTIAALSALAEQLEHGGTSAAEAAASHLGLPTEQVYVWRAQWRQAVRGPEAPALQRRAASRRR